MRDRNKIQSKNQQSQTRGHEIANLKVSVGPVTTTTADTTIIHFSKSHA